MLLTCCPAVCPKALCRCCSARPDSESESDFDDDSVRPLKEEEERWSERFGSHSALHFITFHRYILTLLEIVKF